MGDFSERALVQAQLIVERWPQPPLRSAKTTARTDREERERIAVVDCATHRMCPGRHFARNEIKLATAIVLGEFDLQVRGSEIPPLDNSRAGLGILPPSHDVGDSLSKRGA